MKVEDLVEFWRMLLGASVGNVLVSRDMAEKTLQALARLDNVQDAIADFHDVLKADLE
jgi:hypothetical protein